jgi:hypothetical protein
MTIICAEKEATSRAQGSSAESLAQYPSRNLGYLLTTPRGGCNELIGKKISMVDFPRPFKPNQDV